MFEVWSVSLSTFSFISFFFWVKKLLRLCMTFILQLNEKFITDTKWIQPYCYHWNNTTVWRNLWSNIFFFFFLHHFNKIMNHHFFYMIMINILSYWKSVAFYKCMSYKLKYDFLWTFKSCFQYKDISWI